MTALEHASPAVRRAIAALVVVVCVVAVGLAAVLAFRAPDPGPARSALTAGELQALTAPVAARKPMLIVGDSYSAGYNGVAGDDTFACAVAEALQMACVKDAQGGTGYVNPGTRADDRDNPTNAYGGRLARTAAELGGTTPALIVVTGGRNDLDHPGVRAAARSYVTALRVLYPAARLVVVEPFWGDTTAPAPVERIRADVHAAARAAGARWVPTGDWLTPALIGPDGVHPTPAGQARIADRLATDLREMNR